MTHTTQRILDTLRLNGLALDVRRGGGDTHIAIYDRKTQATHAFAFNTLSEDWVAQEIAERYCTADQQADLLGVQLVAAPRRAG